MRKRPGPAGRRARRPTSELPGDTKEQILAVAEELFAQKGFAGVRTHEIAERAGVNKAMIYYWYQSKEQLLRAVLQKILFELIALSQEILARKLPATEVLEEFYRGFFYYTARHRNFSRLTTMDLGSEGGYLRTMFESFFRPMFERGVKFIDVAVERGELKPVNARQLLITVYGMTIAYFADASQVALLYGVKDALDDKLLEERLQANLDFIFAAIGAKRPSKAR
jgi:TetR/AcrR family transcriptional regulator